MSVLDLNNGARACPLPRRLAAMVYDGLVLVAIWMLGGALVVLPSGGAVESGSLLFQLYLLSLAFAYFGLSWTRSGQTLGMRAWRIRLDPGGYPFGWRRAALRLAGATAGLVLLGGGYAWALGRRDRAAWPDLASDSRLVVDAAVSKAAASKQ